MEPLKVYDLAQQGVQLVRSPLHQRPATEVLEAQNVIFDKDQRGGGTRKRGGLAKLNATPLDGGAVLGAMFVAFPDPTNPLTIGQRRGLYLTDPQGIESLYTDNVVSWNPATFSGDPPFPSFEPGAVSSPSSGPDNPYPVAVGLPGRLYYIGHTGVYNELWRWDGTRASRVLRPPAPPQSGAGDDADLRIGAIYVFDGQIYLAVADGDPDLTGGNTLFGRILRFDPENEVLSQVGTSSWGSHAGGLSGHVPMALEWYQGRLWAATANGQSGVQPRLYSIRPGVDEDWTLEETGTTGHEYVGLKVYRGDLYIASHTRNGTSSLLRKRTPEGTYSTVRTNASTTTGNCYVGLAVVGDKLLVIERAATDTSGAPKLLRYDGSSFTEVIDFYADYFSSHTTGAIGFGAPLEYDGAVFYSATAFSPAGPGGIVLRTTDGATFTEVFSNLGVVGAPNYKHIVGVLRD